MKRKFAYLYFFTCFMMMFSITSYAYIDPSAMTYLIQVVAGVLIAGGAAIGFYWKRIRRFFRNKFKK